MKIVFPELNHPNIQAALRLYNADASLNDSNCSVEGIPAADLTEACNIVKNGDADALIAGIDYSSRDVILACRDNFGMGSFADSLNVLEPLLGLPVSYEPYKTFSGLAVMQKDDKTYLLADMAACKHPTKDQLVEIVEQTYVSAKFLLPDQPRIALLSFSTAGSGGRDDTITLMQSTLAEFRDSDMLIDGEMQLDAAVNPAVGAKKFPGSPVAGHANVLIAPDLNAGNLLYKSFEQIAGYTVAGPILQGFNFHVSDLSRGSSVADIVLTIDSMVKLITNSTPTNN